MAEIIEEQNQAEVTPTPTPVSVPTEKKSGNGAWFGLVIILVVLGLAGAGFLLLQQLRDKQQDLGGELSKDTQQMQELTKQISGYQEQLVAIQSQLTNLSAEVNSKETNYEHKLNEHSDIHNERLDNTAERLKESIQRIQRQLGKTRGDWLVADAEYLLSVANRRLHLMGDVSTTIEALKAADNRLRESGDTAEFKVRGQITKEIALVNKVQVADVVGIYSTLEMLEEDVIKLNVFLPYSGKGKDQENARDASSGQTADDLNDALDNALIEIEGIITIRRLDNPVTEIITPEQKAFINEQLSTKLVIVKLALVQHDDALYQAGIKDVVQWLNKNFTKDAEYKHFMSELDRLKLIQIRSNFPDISQSLKMLRNITKLRLETDKALRPAAEIKSSTKPETKVESLTQPTTQKTQ
ncbi:uroporphyrinogen-III C-methyltransferase [Bathymodiolus platifrons methanotrophic gill symbiont]|uniref:uroporphyrinogen-III C-methyltransferase n=1 Tax=Bathymodiolus platifrons methanotrophic gill symbiont TaxID=113268 RepID=UPI00142DB2D1|nr:uroporphyrinogen-III C-methyltransferase [Bathymodiolus platifrons methanotrophic gill symbiont]MCK5869658.1 uroporphyrinogen-III C-methyltransferase [Methyloprofundus sp.]